MYAEQPSGTGTGRARFRRLRSELAGADGGTNSARSFARQERVLVALNLFALASLAGMHLSFSGITDPFSFELALVLFLVRFVEQAAEWVWLKAYEDRLSETAAWYWARISILANLFFAGLVSIATNSVDAHYTVLLLLPVIAAGFRLRFAYLVATIAAAGLLSLVEIWVYFLRHPPADVEEFFEAATEGLVFVAVGLVSWGLVRTMRRDADTLKAALDALYETRDRLVVEEKLAAVGRLSSAIAHEIRNPVGVIVSALETALRPEVPEPNREELRAMAAAEAARLEKLTADFLTYARTRPPERQPVSVQDTLHYVAGLTRARTGEDGQLVEVVCPEDINLHADPYQVQQALVNLALNAVEYTPAGGRVTLGAEREKARVALYVENTGPVVTEEARLFEPFHTTRPKGTGLGLSITRNIARAHGGDVALTKNVPGGVRFTMYLPMELSHAESPDR